MTCSVMGCDRPSKGKGCARGYCSKHYNRWLKHGDPTISKINRQRDHVGCAVDGCENDHAALGYCQAHYARLKKNGSAEAYSPQYKRKVRWLEAHKDYVADDCLIWPFSTSAHGRGTVSVEGRTMSAPRAMCFLAHGEPPTPDHHAAHSCGSGHLGCMNPQHLSWKTPKENEADKLAHGTLRKGTAINTNKLTEDDVRAIRSMRGKVSGVEIAKAWGVTPANISNIMLRKSWAWLD